MSKPSSKPKQACFCLRSMGWWFLLPALTVGLLCASLFSDAQDLSIPQYIDISRLRNMQPLEDQALFAVLPKSTKPDLQGSLVGLNTKIPQEYTRRIPFGLVGRAIYLKIFLENSSDTVSTAYLFPGLYCRHLDLYKELPGKVRALYIKQPHSSSNDIPEIFQAITLQPHEKTAFIAKLDFVLTTVNSLTPKLISRDFIPYFRSNLLSNKVSVNLLNYLTAGILLMMIFYSLAVFIQNYNIEFLYYAMYALCMAVLLFLKSYLFGNTGKFNFLFEGYLDFIIQLTGYYFYLQFFRKFLTTKIDHPFLEKILQFSSWLIILSALLFSTAYFASIDFIYINSIENISKQLLLIVSIIFIIYGIRKKNRLVNYLVAGQLLLTLFSLVSFLLITTSITISGRPNSLLNDSLLYYQIGLILELVFFLSGLSYKTKWDLIDRIKERERLLLVNERKEFEKQVAILEAKQQERNRISADMHDELGSGVTAIRLMSEIVKTKMKENTLPEIDKISHSADELLNKMNTIIWTMVSSNDTVESLVAYIRAYTVEFFENTPIECEFILPPAISSRDLSGEKRRNLFLAFKEALNNVLKHSQASKVVVRVQVNERLLIEIADNGIGINLDNVRKFGNGLQNMRKRIASISGECKIENHMGTKTTFELGL